MKTLQNHLGLKLIFSFISIILVFAIVLLGAVLVTVQGAYMRHMQTNPADMMQDENHASEMMGQGQGRGLGYAPVQGLNNFRAGVFDAIGYAFIIAILVALGVSIAFSRQIVSPLRAMMNASLRIADGHYAERVSVEGSDELAQLAARFNRMAERLEQTESMRLRLIGDVSHELRTPLTVISGYMEGLQDGVLPATSDTYEQVKKEAGRLSRLVDDLQELSRVEARSYKMDIHPVALADIITTITKRMSHPFAEKHISLQVDLSDIEKNPSLQVLVDEDRVIQVMTNLLGNALIYTQAGGKVLISASKNQNMVQVAIKDNGIGIDSANIEYIFDRFFRADKSRTRIAGGGSGIGLTIARAIVEAHGGRIWVESEGIEKGTTFFFTLPVVTE